MKKMLVLDIDGTLTNSKKEITDKTLNAILDIQEMGHIVVLASGRPTPGMKKIAEKLKLNVYGGYVLSYNGAKIINSGNNEVVYQKVLDPIMIPKLYEYALEHKMGLVTYETDCVITGTPIDKWMEFEAKINGLEIKYIDNFVQYIDFPVNKCLLTAEGHLAEVATKELSDMFSGEANIFRSEPFFVEVMSVGIDKAASLDKLVKMLNINIEDVIACGDGFNDISMIKYAGVGVAMANAQDPVKDVADYVTLSNDEDGLVQVINKFIK